MIVTIVISVLTFLSLILSIIFIPKIKIRNFSIPSYVLVTLLGAALLLITNSLSIDDLGNALITNSNINPLKILSLFFSMTFISIFLDVSGFFKWLANKCVERIKSKQIYLFLIFYTLVSILTVFTSNDIVILTMTPFICYLCKNAKINPLPYLVGEFAAANTWSMMLIIGNPTNIYLATNANIDFISYIKVMGIPTFLSGIIELIILLAIFNKELKKPINSLNIEEIKLNKRDTYVGLIVLFICLIFLISSSYIDGLEMWIVATSCFGFLLIYLLVISLLKRKNLVWKVSKSLPFSLIPFILSMFIIVLALSTQGVSKELAKAFASNEPVWVYGTTSFISCNLMNNIPMSMFFSNILLESSNSIGATYATIIGSNLGAFLTPVGALAGIMFTSLINKQNVKYTFIDFIKYGVMISIPTLAVALSSLMIFA